MVVVVQVGPVSAVQQKLTARAPLFRLLLIISNSQSLSARCYDIGA